MVFLLLLLIIFPIGRIVWQKWDYYLSPFDLERAQGLYNISQYVKEEGAAWIADEIVFAYAGWNYINGGNPILLNPENPPLGKYLVGLSIKLFNNEKIPTLIFGLLSLFSFFLLCRLFLKKTWLALLPVAVLVLLASYGRLLAEGWSIYKVLSVQKWILWYHQSRLIELGSVWPLIYLNRWYVWWGDQPYLAMVQWSLFWPIFTTLALIFSILVFLKIAGLARNRLKNFKFDQKITVLCLWVVFYLAFLSLGNISSRYLFYLLPYCYLLGVYGISKFRKLLLT